MSSAFDTSHDDRGHADLAVVLFRDGFDGSTRFEEISSVTKHSISSVSIRSQFASSKDCFHLYEVPASRVGKQVSGPRTPEVGSNCNLHRL